MADSEFRQLLSKRTKQRRTGAGNNKEVSTLNVTQMCLTNHGLQLRRFSVGRPASCQPRKPLDIDETFV